MAFIRKFKTGSGATGVQVCWKQGGEVVKTVHIGSANSEVGLEKLLKKDTFCRSIRVLFSTVIFAEHSLAIPSKKAARYGAAFIFASRKFHFTGTASRLKSLLNEQ